MHQGNTLVKSERTMKMTKFIHAKFERIVQKTERNERRVNKPTQHQKRLN